MKVLVADDSRVTLIKLKSVLKKWGYDVLAVENGDEAWKILRSDDTPKLAILDWMMPGMDGIEICRRLRSCTKEPYVYILMLTAKTGKQDIINGLEAGADDYVAKPFNTQELEVRLRTGKRIVELQEKLVCAREKMREMALRDALTHLFNRRAILEILHEEYNRSQRQNSPLGVVMADIDHFKKVNDTYGHLVGDVVLSQVAERMSSSIRPYDSVGRYGGEEFLVILPGCSLGDAVKQANRLHEVIGSTPIEYGDCSIHTTVSFGVTSFDNTIKSNIEELVRFADEALYQAKMKGRNLVEPVQIQREISSSSKSVNLLLHPRSQL